MPSWLAGLLSATVLLPIAFGQVPIHEIGEPTLKETLAWLKEKIPLGTVQYVRILEPEGINGFSITESVNIQSAVWNADSCTVTVGEVSTSKTLSSLPQVDKSGDQLAESSITSRYTVPLEELTGWTVERKENEDPADGRFSFVSGDRWGYRVVLSSKSKAIRGVISATLSAPSPYFPNQQSASYDTLHIVFNDPKIARRVSDAFHHASDLCRQKEVF